MFKARIDMSKCDLLADDIRALIDGEIVLLEKSKAVEGEYLILGFLNSNIDKEFWWLIAKDDTFGSYNDYNEFSEDYDNDNYYSDILITIPKDYFEVIE